MEGCRPVSRGLMLELVTASDFIEVEYELSTCEWDADKSVAPVVMELVMVAGEGFEPSKAEPGDLQSPPIGRSGNPPGSNFVLRLW